MKDMKLIMENWQEYVNETEAEAVAEPASSSKEGMDWVGLALDAFGLIPIVGEPIDVLAALRHIKRKEYFFALLSIISVIPEVGDAIGKSAKYLGKGGEFLARLFKSGKTQQAVTKGSAQAVKSLESLSGLLGKEGVKSIANFVKKHDSTIKAAINTLFSKSKKAVAESMLEAESEEDDQAEFLKFIDSLTNYAV